MSDSIISSFDSHVWTPDSKEESSQILPTQYYAWGKALEVKVCLGSQQVGKAGTETTRVCSLPSQERKHVRQPVLVLFETNVQVYCDYAAVL